MNPKQLNPKQQSIIAISSFTANGNLEKLKGALNEGLDAGLTVNEIKEVLVQLYAYAGFPRSLNGINTFMAVMDERKAKGISDMEGREASPMPSNWNRDEYGAQVRAKLSGRDTIPGLGGQLQFHMNAAMNTGLNEAQMKDFISVLTDRVGEDEAQAANTVLARVFASRTK